MKHAQIKSNRISQPRSSLRMISILICLFAGHSINRVRVDERTQGSTMYDEPGDERSELCRREEVHFEHSDGVWSDWLFPETVDAEFWDCGRLVDT